MRKAVPTAASDTMRRLGWVTDNASLGTLSNAALAGAAFAMRSRQPVAYPTILKIDISPHCNLGCTVCVHKKPEANDTDALKGQLFRKGQFMSVEQYAKIIDEVKGKTSAVSLYYLGDPLIHPELTTFCRITADAGINVHVNTNFSFRLSDEQIVDLSTCGITHFTACVDGLSQEKYELTRKRGKIDLVLSNLKRMMEVKREQDVSSLKVEVQYIKFQHNVDELDAAIAIFKDLGVDQITDFWGSLHNYTDLNPDQYEILGARKSGRLPLCYWPYISMLIKYNGDVIPCCSFRGGEQYTDRDHRSLGNVFEDGVMKVWRSSQYGQARTFVSDPEKMVGNEEGEAHFCFGCPRVFETTANDKVRNGKDHRIEDVHGVPSVQTVQIRVPKRDADRADAKV